MIASILELIDAIAEWVKVRAVFSTLLVTVVLAVGGGILKLFLNTRSKKRSQADAALNVGLGSGDNLIIPASIAGRVVEALAHAIEHDKKRSDQTVSDLKTFRARLIEEVLEHGSVQELRRVALRVSREAGQWGNQRSECIDMTLLMAYLRPSAEWRDFGFATYFMSERQPAEKLLVTWFEMSDFVQFLRSLSSQKSNDIESLVELLRANNRALKLGDLLGEFDNREHYFRLAPEVKRLTVHLAAALKAYGKGRVDHLVDRSMSIADIAVFNRRQDSAPYVPMVYVTASDKLDTIANNVCLEFDAERTDRMRAPPPVSHVYGAALRAYFRKHNPSEECLGRLLASATAILRATEIFSNRDASEMAELGRLLGVFFDELDPFHDDVADSIVREQADMMRRFRNWESDLREGRQIISNELFRMMAQFERRPH